MNFSMIRPKNETEDLLLSNTKNCETLIEQTHTKIQETLEYKMIKSREIFHFNPPVPIEGSWMIGLTVWRYIILFIIYQKKITNWNFINFLMKKLLVFLLKKSEMRLKETWIFRRFHLPIY